jgi:hypothetical protein
MSTTAKTRQADQAPSRWAALGGLVVEWTFAVAQLAFGILLFGFAGGFFGTFVDLGLAFFREEWVGYGRTVGWSIAALAGAIGLPMGWARINNRTLKFPSPRQARQRLAERKPENSGRRQQEFRRVRDVVKAAGGLALVGGILGLFLGCLLMMSWFSLAMSPLASTEWFNEIEWNSTRQLAERPLPQDDPHGSVITTDSPIAFHLFFWPTATLATAGLVLGTCYGAYGYVGHRRRKGHCERAEA